MTLPRPRGAVALRHAAQAAGSLMFAAVFAVFMLKLVLRYAAGIQLAWADEVCTILFVWIIFWANAVLVPDEKQIAFDLAVRALPPGGRRAAALLRDAALFGLFAAALPATLGYTLFLARQTTPVLGLRLDLVYACYPLFLACACARAGARLLAAFRVRQRRAV